MNSIKRVATVLIIVAFLPLYKTILDYLMEGEDTAQYQIAMMYAVGLSGLICNFTLFAIWNYQPKKKADNKEKEKKEEMAKTLLQPLYRDRQVFNAFVEGLKMGVSEYDITKSRLDNAKSHDEEYRIIRREWWRRNSGKPEWQAPWKGKI